LVKTGVPLEVCYEHYWSEMLAAVKAGGFECVAHMDFPKRYYGKLWFEAEAMYEICREMVRNGICLEINTSSLRQNIAGAMPDKEILEIYKSCGGRYATVASDAHSVEDLAAGYRYAKDLIAAFGLEEIVFHQREMRAVSELR
jgi:histidinol-phosphatase (PHP family)